MQIFLPYINAAFHHHKKKKTRVTFNNSIFKEAFSVPKYKTPIHQIIDISLKEKVIRENFSFSNTYANVN